LKVISSIENYASLQSKFVVPTIGYAIFEKICPPRHLDFGAIGMALFVSQLAGFFVQAIFFSFPVAYG
jgi:hypothetical protein